MNPAQLITFRADFLARIRTFFSQRACVEVDTALLRSWTVTDPYMRALSALSPAGHHQGFLQTSPEYAMKRLLALAGRDIFQLGKVFRADETSERHAIEFCMLEWYRVGWDHWRLMGECAQLLTHLLGPRRQIYLSWQEASELALGVDLSCETIAALRQRASAIMGEMPQDLRKDDYLTLLFDQLVEPSFDNEALTFVYGFPASQASLAQIEQLKAGNPHVSERALDLAKGNTIASRFEIFSGGLELANGFHELIDATEQQRRFEQDNQVRAELGYPQQAFDQDLSAALSAGIPESAGVAIGIDRVMMLASGATRIQDIQL